MTKPTATDSSDAGADVITLGNHTFAKRDLAAYRRRSENMRPANYPPGVPGRGCGVFRDGRRDRWR